MIAYVDASIALRVVLRQQPALADWGRWQRVYTNELFGVECRRVLDRLRLEGRITDAQLGQLQDDLARIEAALDIVALTRTILRRAALPMATPVRTLDALHLATALTLRERIAEDLVFATHDDQQATAARALGFPVTGVAR